MSTLTIKPKRDCLWDLVSLGEVMLRLDPGDQRISTAREFRAWEGGGEYNVARGLRRCFGLDTAIVTALADNPVGRLVEDLMLQGGVAQKYVRWVPFDGVGRTVRNGLNFTERGFGVRAAVGCSDRGHTAVSQLKPGDIDWAQIFSKDGARWFHTGGIFCALSETTPLVAQEAMQAAKQVGAIVSYDLNYRASLWKSIGGKAKAQEVNRRLAPYVDVMLGNEEDFTAALGFSVSGLDEHHSKVDASGFKTMIEAVVKQYPSMAVIATTLRNAKTATRNDWGALCYPRRQVLRSTGAREPGNLRPRRRRRFVCLRTHLRISLRQRSAVVGRMRCRTWRSRHDHPGRYHDGHAARSAAGHDITHREDRALKFLCGTQCPLW